MSRLLVTHELRCWIVELVGKRPAIRKAGRCVCGRWLPRFVVRCQTCGRVHPETIEGITIAPSTTPAGNRAPPHRPFPASAALNVIEFLGGTSGKRSAMRPGARRTRRPQRGDQR